MKAAIAAVGAGVLLAGCGRLAPPPAPPAGAWVNAAALAPARAVLTQSINGPLALRGGWFVDECGRVVMLRGVNVAGASKVPARGGEGAADGRFAAARDVSFSGRPLPLAEAPGHFARLTGAGFHFIRLLVSWEAIEGRGPGVYDREYLGYLDRLVAVAGEAGLRVVIDLHQDVWSRFSGGDGAPRWTLEEVGFDLGRIRASGAAMFADQYADNPAGVVWLGNHERLACATMFTLFFAGDDFAPHCRARDGTPLQQFLQRHYLAAATELARTLRRHRHVIGFDMMNEPGSGLIGRKELADTGVFALDVAPTPLQAFAAGSGIPQQVARRRLGPLGPRSAGTAVLNPDGVSAWRSNMACPWRRHGVWGLDARGRPVVLDSDYFAVRDGRPVDFVNDYYRPFVERFARAIRAVDPRLLVFIEEPVLAEDPGRSEIPDWHGRAPAGVVNASHWYDAATVATRRYRNWVTVDTERQTLVLGRNSVRRAFDRRLAGIEEESRRRIGPRPVLIGEFGVPFNRRSPGGADPFAGQQRALDAYYRALERRLLGNAVRHYGPWTTAAGGDAWCGEDFSIFRADLDGGRMIEAVVRPYPLAVPGRMLESRYDAAAGEFRCRFERDPAVPAPALVFVPVAGFGDSFEVAAPGGSLAFDRRRRLLVDQPGPGAGEHLLVVRRR